MKENFSLIKPQIVENFMQRLMENYQDGRLEITFRTDHREACLLSLGCDVMARERSSFESYSVCYEHLSEHVRQKLRQKEQELDILRSGQSPPEDNAGQEKLDENQLNLIQKVSELISEVRAEWMDHVKDLKKKMGLCQA